MTAYNNVILPTHHAYTWQIGPVWQDTLDKGMTPVLIEDADSGRQ